LITKRTHWRLARIPCEQLDRWDRLLAGLFLGLVVAVSALAAHTHVIIASDPITHYIPAAQGLLSGQGIEALRADTFRGPLLPILTAVVSGALGLSVFSAGLVVSVVAYAAFILAIFLTVRSVFGSRLAALTVLAAGANATLLFTSVSWLTDVLCTAFAWLALWLMVRRSGQRWFSPLMAGIMAGLALDTRWNAIYPLIAADGLVFLNPARHTWRQRLSWAAWFGLGFLASAGPWFYVNTVLHGSPFYNTVGPALHADLLSPRLPPEPALFDVLRLDPIFFFTHYARWALWDGLITVFGTIPFILAIFAPAGLLALLLDLDRRRAALLMFTGIFWAIAAVTHFEARFYLVMLPVMVLLPLYFVGSSRLQLGANPWVRRLLSLGPLMLLLALAISQYLSVWHAVSKINASLAPEADAARWLQARAGDNASRVAVRFYSGARYFIPALANVDVTFLPIPATYLDPPPQYSHLLVEEGLPDPVGGEVPADVYNPLAVGPQLEAVYFQPQTPRAVFYRVRRGYTGWSIQSAVVSSSLDEARGITGLLDEDPSTGWVTPPQPTADSPVTLTVDLGQTRALNRIWLLPAADPALLPSAFLIEISTDGEHWQTVASQDEQPAAQRQDPLIFAFPESEGRFVRFTALHLRAGAASAYQAGLNALRIGQWTVATHASWAETPLVYNPLTGVLRLTVRNVDQVTRALGITLEIDHATTLLLPAVLAPAGQTAIFDVALIPWLAPGPHSLMATLTPSSGQPGSDNASETVTVGEMQTLDQLPFGNLVGNADFDAGTGGWQLDAVTHLDPDEARQRQPAR
jgi:hypothetical protein